MVTCIHAKSNKNHKNQMFISCPYNRPRLSDYEMAARAYLGVLIGEGLNGQLFIIILSAQRNQNNFGRKPCQRLIIKVLISRRVKCL